MIAGALMEIIADATVIEAAAESVSVADIHFVIVAVTVAVAEGGGRSSSSSNSINSSCCSRKITVAVVVATVATALASAVETLGAIIVTEAVAAG